MLLAPMPLVSTATNKQHSNVPVSAFDIPEYLQLTMALAHAGSLLVQHSAVCRTHPLTLQSQLATHHYRACPQVYNFPSGASSLLSHSKAFLTLAVCGLLTSFTSTLMFTAMGSFFNRISDPGMGGAYLTLLNTIANMGNARLCTWAFMSIS